MAYSSLHYVPVARAFEQTWEEEKPLAHSFIPSWPSAFYLSRTWVIFKWRLPTVSIRNLMTLQKLSPAPNFTVHYVACVFVSQKKLGSVCYYVYLAVIYVLCIKTLLPDLFFWGKWRHNKTVHSTSMMKIMCNESNV